MIFPVNDVKLFEPLRKNLQVKISQHNAIILIEATFIVTVLHTFTLFSFLIFK